jgi:succinate dehydrogenase/fumarate reductase flavoprotein subunit
MVGEEGKTRIPILHNYSGAGFDPDKDLLQSYGEGWQSGTYLPQERQLFGYPGGLVNDWRLKTNLEGLFAAGDQLFAANCHGHAAATGHYAGRHAAAYAESAPTATAHRRQADGEKDRIRSILNGFGGVDWREVNTTISLIMQEHCGATKSGEVLAPGLVKLRDLRRHELLHLRPRNPHELMRTLEVLNILTNAELVIHACLAREASARYLLFERSDFPALDPPEWQKFVTVRLENETVVEGAIPLDYYGQLEENYLAYNADYVGGLGR